MIVPSSTVYNIMIPMITLEAKKLRSHAHKTRGLIGAKKIYPVFFTTRWGIHTFGVLFPIDVLILNDENTVVALRSHLPPNRIFFWNPKYERVVELPAGTIQDKKIELGETITLHHEGNPSTFYK